MFAAAATKGGVGGVQSVGKDFAEADPGGKLPEKKGKSKVPYTHSRKMAN